MKLPKYARRGEVTAKGRAYAQLYSLGLPVPRWAEIPAREFCPEASLKAAINWVLRPSMGCTPYFDLSKRRIPMSLGVRTDTRGGMINGPHETFRTTMTLRWGQDPALLEDTIIDFVTSFMSDSLEYYPEITGFILNPAFPPKYNFVDGIWYRWHACVYLSSITNRLEGDIALMSPDNSPMLREAFTSKKVRIVHKLGDPITDNLEFEIYRQEILFLRNLLRQSSLYDTVCEVSSVQCAVCRNGFWDTDANKLIFWGTRGPLPRIGRSE